MVSHLLVFMAWNATDFNTFSVDVVISPSVATCKNIRIHFGRGVDAKLAILIDDQPTNQLSKYSAHSWTYDNSTVMPLDWKWSTHSVDKHH